MSGKADSLRSVLYALAANFAIALAKSAGAAYTGSSAMLAEAIHSFADCGNQGLLLWGMRRTRKPPTPEHPLGYGKTLYFWSFIVALMLFSMGGLFSIYEGLHKLASPEPMKDAWVALGILGFGIVAEAFSLWGALREIDKEREGRGYWAWFRRSRTSELVVIFGEDLAALGGLVLAFGFIILAMITGNPGWDALGSVAIGCLLVLVAVLVGREVASMLVGQSADPAVEAALRAHLQAQPEVRQVFNLITQQLGPDVMLAVKVAMAPQPSDRALIDAINRVERSLHAGFPQLRWCFFEPDASD
ncbi:MAG: cation diffusion facilitator family transporter [Ideonella sp.]|nr:cation diffusion facilitator family transporter [Ideonella sp.]MCC7459505.1 cation diffusion facilitator family transporter [Nitrospira sp.]